MIHVYLFIMLEWFCNASYNLAYNVRITFHEARRKKYILNGEILILLYQIKYHDYLLFADQIVIIDKALEEIRREGGTSEYDSRQKNSVAERNQVPWTVLVAGLRLLWTLDIRDSMMSIVKDILFAINLMQVNSRGTLLHKH